MKYLVVDDHAGIRAVLKASLCGPQDEWGECAGGAEVLAAYERFQPDWVLMDIEMKDLDGLIALRRLRAAFPDARVVMVTNHGDLELRAAAARSGAAGYVLKEHLDSLKEFFLNQTPANSRPRPAPQRNP